MQKSTLHANPFALMMDPAAVLDAMERSERLNHLQSRVCRPLDRLEALAQQAAAKEQRGQERALEDALPS